MQPVRLIAMDMDGTLLTRIDPVTACIPPENAAALRRCMDAGVHLALASGRMPDDASFFADDAAIPMHIIGLNGSVTLDHPFGSVLSEHFLTEADARRILSILMDSGADVCIFGQWEVVCMQDRPLSWAQRELGTYFGRTGGRLTYRSGGDGAESLISRAGKIVALTESDREGLALARERISRELPHLKITSSWWNNFEVNPAGVDKGSALRELADRLGIPMEQVMAIGDNDNDVPMLKVAPISVAMGNASPAARDAARYLTLPNDRFGVAEAIHAIVFGEHSQNVHAQK